MSDEHGEHAHHDDDTPPDEHKPEWLAVGKEVLIVQMQRTTSAVAMLRIGMVKRHTKKGVLVAAPYVSGAPGYEVKFRPGTTSTWEGYGGGSYLKLTLIEPDSRLGLELLREDRISRTKRAVCSRALAVSKLNKDLTVGDAEALIEVLSKFIIFMRATAANNS